MSAIRHNDDVDRHELADFPEFELCYRFDDADAPTRVTVFSPGMEIGGATRWFTVDREVAVPLEDVR
ncbi:MAG: hypothetical protein ABEJ44_03285 [Halanaeroarchaeum sp.]